MSEHEQQLEEERAGGWPEFEGWRVVMVDERGDELALLPAFAQDEHELAAAFAAQLEEATTDGIRFEVRAVKT